MNPRSCRSAAYGQVSEGGLEPPHPQRVDQRKRRAEHETGSSWNLPGPLRSRRIRSVVDAVNIIALSIGLILVGACTSQASVLAPHSTARFPFPPTAPTATVAQLGAFLATVKADDGTSVLLPSGKVLWLFGDRLSDDGSHFISRNAYAIQSGSSFAIQAGELQPSTATSWFWPGAAVVDAGRLVILWSERVQDGSDFGKQGRTLAISYDPATLQQTGQTSVPGAVGGSSAVKVGVTWQVFGTRAVEGSYGKRVVEWTVPAGQFGDLSRWPAPTTVLPASWGAGTDVAVVKEGSWLRLYTKRYDIVGTDIVTAASKALGGWSAPTVVKTTGPWTYAVHAHPEQQTPSLTYALNGPGTGAAGTYHLYPFGL